MSMAYLRSLISLFLQIFVHVIGSGERWFVFCYNQRHKQFEVLTYNNSSKSWSTGESNCMTIISKLEAVLDQPLVCNRKQAHVQWKEMDKVCKYDGGLLAMRFLEHYDGEPNWLMDDMNLVIQLKKHKASILLYLLNHKLNDEA